MRLDSISARNPAATNIKALHKGLMSISGGPSLLSNYAGDSNSNYGMHQSSSSDNGATEHHGEPSTATSGGGNKSMKNSSVLKVKPLLKEATHASFVS